MKSMFFGNRFWLKKIQISFVVYVFLFFNVFSLVHYQAVASDNTGSNEINLLFSRLNSDFFQKELENKNSDSIGLSVSALLHYFKFRTIVNHPEINKNYNQEISEKEQKYADDALKHIFVGQPAYPSHFCGDDINWSTNPVTDNEWVWQLNRMVFWNAMGRVYATSKNEKYAKEWSKQLVHWVKNNPRDDEHKYAWRSIEAGIRGYSWTTLYHQFIKSEHFNEETLVWFLNSLYEHATFLMTVYRSGSNWGLMEAEGLAFIAINFPEFKDAIKWREEAFRRLNIEISTQVYPDGHQRELAIGYHLGCIRWFYRTYELAKLNGLENAFPDSYLDMIEKMCEIPMKIGLPDGTNVQFGDAWRGEPGQHNKNFKEWAEMFNRDDFLFLATAGKQGTQPNETAFALPQSGIYSMRSSWDKNATCLVLKCGPDGGGHCQPDNGTFVLFVNGKNLMPDAGSYIYSGNPEGRRWFRQTKVHQTLTLNNQNSDYAPKLLHWETGNNLDILVVENQSYENLVHRRSVFFIEKRYFLVVDEAFGNAKGKVDIHFQLAPDTVNCTFDFENLTVEASFLTDCNLLVKTKKQTGTELVKEEGWVSFEYTKKQTRPAFAFSTKKENENYLQFASLVIPYQNQIPDVEIIEIQQEDNSKSLKFKLKENGKIISAGYNL